MANIVGLKVLRESTESYIRRVRRGKSFIVMRRSEPVFRISPVDDPEMWESVVDFTKIKKGGISLKDLLSRL